MSKLQQFTRETVITTSNFFSNTYQKFDAMLITSLHSRDDASIFAFNSIAHKSLVKLAKILLFLIVLVWLYFLCLSAGLFFEYVGVEDLFYGNGTNHMCTTNVYRYDTWIGCPAFGVLMICICVVIVTIIALFVSFVMSEYSDTVKHDFDIGHKKTYGTFYNLMHNDTTYNGL